MTPYQLEIPQSNVADVHICSDISPVFTIMERVLSKHHLIVLVQWLERRCLKSCHLLWLKPGFKTRLWLSSWSNHFSTVLPKHKPPTKNKQSKCKPHTKQEEQMVVQLTFKLYCRLKNKLMSIKVVWHVKLQTVYHYVKFSKFCINSKQKKANIRSAMARKELITFDLLYILKLHKLSQAWPCPNV